MGRTRFSPITSYYEAALLRSLNFYLDIGADSTFPPSIDVHYSYHRYPTTHSEYIHRSGTLLVAILDAGDDDGDGVAGFAYMPNRIFTSHREEADPDVASGELVRLCRDKERLEALWERLRREVEGEGEREGRLTEQSAEGEGVVV